MSYAVRRFKSTIFLKAGVRGPEIMVFFYFFVQIEWVQLFLLIVNVGSNMNVRRLPSRVDCAVVNRATKRFIY